MDCYLFSSFPEPSAERLVELVGRLVSDKANPIVAYLPAGNIKRHFVREIRGFLREVAEVKAFKPEVHPIKRLYALLDQANVLLIPGGNTYLLAHRLHLIGIVTELRQRVLDGLPLITFSAGTVFCGQDILTSNDINCCGCTQFAGLKLVPFSINVHYPSVPSQDQLDRDKRLNEYLEFYVNPVLALEDSACLHINTNVIEVVNGSAWMFSGGAKGEFASCHC